MATVWGGEAAASREISLAGAVSVDSGAKTDAAEGARSRISPPSSARVWKRIHFRTAALAAVISLAPVMAGGQSVPNSVYSGGGGVVMQGNLKLSYTLGEHAAGPVSTGTTRVIAGFQATFLPPDDNGKCTIFCDGFE